MMKRKVAALAASVALVGAVPVQAQDANGIYGNVYGCSVQSAGFFMPRGMRLFGWGFVIAGLLSALAAANPHQIEPSIRMAHSVMTATFGGGHLAYGLYLRWTEKNSAT